MTKTTITTTTLRLTGLWPRLLQQPLYGSLDFDRDNPGEPVPEETFTHIPIMCIKYLYLFPPSTMIHGILLVQFTCLTVFLQEGRKMVVFVCVCVTFINNFMPHWGSLQWLFLPFSSSTCSRREPLGQMRNLFYTLENKKIQTSL